MIRRALTLLAALTLGAPLAGAQSVIIGTVLSRERQLAVPYAAVSVVIGTTAKREFVTTDRGTFALHDLPAGPVAIRIRRAGMSPLDTTISVGVADTVRLSLVMVHLTISLPAVEVWGPCGGTKSKESSDASLLHLFAQIGENAGRVRALAVSNPFVMDVERSAGYRAGRIILAGKRDTIHRPSRDSAAYKPGAVIIPDPSPRPGSSGDAIMIPELVDLADTAFTGAHCFRFAGTDKIDTVRVVSIEFEPAPALTGIDIKGTVVLRASDFQIVRTEIQLAGKAADLAVYGVKSASLVTTFREIVPGIPVLDRMESTVTRSGRSAPFGEVQRLVNVSWMRGPP